MHSNLQHKRSRLRKQRIRNITLNVLGSLFALGGILWGANALWRYYKYETTDDAYIDQYMAPVNVRIGGYISRINFAEHSPVKKGDTLLIIDPREYIIRTEEAQAAYDQAVAQAEAIQAAILSAQSNTQVAKANVAENDAVNLNLEEKAKRYESLYEKNAVSKQEYEQTVSDYEASKAKSESLIMLKKSKEFACNELQQNYKIQLAVIEQKKAALEMAQLNQSYTAVIAPRDGFTGRRTCENGQLVQAGQTITNIIDEKEKWITANYKETQIAGLYIGQPVTIRIDAFRKKKFTGKITAISEATGSRFSLLPVDNAAGNFVKVQQRIPVRIDFTSLSAEDEQLLRAGMMSVVEAHIKHE